MRDMGRFSRLETGDNAAGSTPPICPDIEKTFRPSEGSGADYSDMDAVGCLHHGDRALFMEEQRTALRWYSRAVDLDSTRLESWTRMIGVLLMRRDLGEAGAWIGRGLTAYPDAPSLMALRAVEHARRGMIRQAMAASDAVIERAGGDPTTQIARGEVLLLAENRNAGYCFDQALQQTAPDDWRTPTWIALILKERRMWAKAIDYLARAIDRREREALVWFQVGLCRAALGHRPQAAKAFETAAEHCASDDPLLAKIERANAGTFWDVVRGLLRLGR
jgi:tetratricopeptide (TPR) repeat protein